MRPSSGTPGTADRPRRAVGAALALTGTLAALLVVAVLLGAAAVALAGCAVPAARDDPTHWTGFPQLPAVLDPAPAPDPLPADGPVGRGALVFNGPAGPILVLETGRQLLLPRPPPGEGRQGTVWASLSPNGRWLGYRRSAYVTDPRYLIRDLGGTTVTAFDGIPRSWSPDSRFLLAESGPDALVVEAATGVVRWPGGRPDGVRPGGQPFNWPASAHSGGVAADQEGWVPYGAPVLSPDGARVYTLGAYQRGLILGTDQKSPARPDDACAILTVDWPTGDLRGRLVLTGDEGTQWTMMADTGAGLLLLRRTHSSGDYPYSLRLIDPETGGQGRETALPTGLVAVPGQVLYTGE